MIALTQKAAFGQPVTTVWLVGMPGSGKSTLASFLQERFGLPSSDTDELFPAGSHLTAVDLVADEFYNVEEKVVVDYASTLPSGIIATGGSVVHREGACNAMREKPGSIVVYLYTPLDVLARRLGNFDERGVIFPEGVNNLSDLYHYREPLYRKHCDYILDTSSQNVEECAESIRELFSEKK